MNETDIRKYAALMQELGLTGLEIKEDNKIVRLEKTPPTVVKETVSVASAPETTHAEKREDDYISIKSPTVGVFYAAPAENADPYVSIGTHIKKGQTLCIIEAMKLMNEICAEEEGTIMEVCVTNGQIVEFGTELFKLKR